MGIFERLGTLIKSNLNDLISSAEEPEKMLNQVLLDMQQQLASAKQAVAIAIADEKKLNRQQFAEQEKAQEWEKKAMVAVRAGDDNLAKQALARRQEHEAIADQYQTQWAQQKAAVDKLKLALGMLADKIEEAKRKKNILIARSRRAEAQRSIANTMEGIGDTSAFDTFNRMADKVDEIEAQAEASAELAGELNGGSLESKIKQLEAQGYGGGGSDAALLELKAKMGVALPAGSAPAALPAGDEHLSADDMKELAALDLPAKA